MSSAAPVHPWTMSAVRAYHNQRLGLACRDICPARGDLGSGSAHDLRVFADTSRIVRVAAERDANVRGSQQRAEDRDPNATRRQSKSRGIPEDLASNG